MAEKKDNNRVPEAELILPRGKKVILQAEDTDYKRGLIVELLDNGGYEMAYWYDKPDKPYPVEILVDGQSIKPDGKVVEMKFHPQDYYDEQDELNEVTRYSGFNRNPEDPDSESFKPTGSVSEFKEDLRALFGKFKGDLRNPEFIKGVAQIMNNWKPLLRSQLNENFEMGDRVKLTPDYEETPGEVFTITQISGNKYFIADEDGRGWYTYGGQLVMADDEYINEAKKKKAKKKTIDQ